MSPRTLIGLCSLVVVVLSMTVALGPLEGIPHITDEIAYTLQSRLLAAGLRVGPPGDDPALMSIPFWVVQPQTTSPFPVGWPLLLSIGERLGAFKPDICLTIWLYLISFTKIDLLTQLIRARLIVGNLLRDSFIQFFY